MATNPDQNRNTAVYRVIREVADMRGWSSHNQIYRATGVYTGTLDRWREGGGNKTTWFARFEQAAGLPTGLINKVYEQRMTPDEALATIRQADEPAPPADVDEDLDADEVSGLDFRLDNLEVAVVNVRRAAANLQARFDELEGRIELLEQQAPHPQR